MSTLRRGGLLAVMAALALVTLAEGLAAQVGPSPFRTVDGWAKLPAGRQMGAVGDVTIDPDGEHVWAVVRCDAGADRFGDECLDSDLDPIIKFDSEGNTVESFGGGMFIWPHGIDVDPDGNVWVTDGVSAGNTPQGGDERPSGHQVQSQRTGSDDTRHAWRSGRGSHWLQLPRRCGRSGRWIHLRRGWPCERDE